MSESPHPIERWPEITCMRRRAFQGPAHWNAPGFPSAWEDAESLRKTVEESPWSEAETYVPLARLQEVEGEVALHERAIHWLADRGNEEKERRESAETRLREAEAERDKWKALCLFAEADRIDLREALEAMVSAVEDALAAPLVPFSHEHEEATAALGLSRTVLAKRFTDKATDPNETDTDPGGGKENSQRTSDSEDKAVPGLATEGDDG